ELRPAERAHAQLVIVQEAAIESAAQVTLVQILADDDELLAAIAEGTAEVRADDLLHVIVFGPKRVRDHRPPSTGGLVTARGARLRPQARLVHARGEPEQTFAAHHARPVLVQELPEPLRVEGAARAVHEARDAELTG